MTASEQKSNILKTELSDDWYVLYCDARIGVETCISKTTQDPTTDRGCQMANHKSQGKGWAVTEHVLSALPSRHFHSITDVSINTVGWTMAVTNLPLPS